MKLTFVLSTLVASSLIGSVADPADNTEKTLAGKSVPLNEPGFCVASDGAVWACRGDFGLERFDGEAWRDTNTFIPVGQLALDTDVQMRLTPFSLVPAQNGWVLTYIGHRVSDLHVEHGMLLNHLFYPVFMLLNGQSGGGAPNFEVWMASSRERFLEAFSQPLNNRAWFTSNTKVARKDRSGRVTIGAKALIRPGIVVDKHKNIWGSAGWTAAVFTKKGAMAVNAPADGTKPPPVQVPQALLNLGVTPEGMRRPVSLSLPGDGEYVFLRLEDGDTYFVRLTTKGELDFQNGPKLSTVIAPYDQWPLRDTLGGLWLIVDSGRHQAQRFGHVAPPTATLVRRVTGPDTGEDFKDKGIPRVVDAAGCVWLVPYPEGNQDVATVWTPGGKTFTVKLPRRASKDFVVAGERGHVFVQTTGGLQEFVANDPETPSEYVPATLYHLDGLDGANVLDMQYSSLGYLAVVEQKQGADGGGTMHLFPLGPTQTVRKLTPRAVAANPDKLKPGTTAKKRPLSPPAAPAELRTWQDTTGQFTIKAKLLRASAGTVTLRKEDGSTIKVPLEKLSDEDQEYIRNR